jgi:hypothetical protein
VVLAGNLRFLGSLRELGYWAMGNVHVPVIREASCK